MSLTLATNVSAIKLLKTPQGGMIEDINPENNIDADQYVCAVIDNKNLYGYIQKIQNRNVTIKLDSPWMRRKYITVNWTYLRKASIYEKNKEELTKKNMELSKEQKIETIKNNIIQKNTEFFNINKTTGDVKADLSRDEEDFFEQNKKIQFILCNIDKLIDSFNVEKNKIIKIKEQCEASGSSLETISALNQIIENVACSRTPKSLKNITKDNKRRLSTVRDTTKNLLRMVLVESGEQGIDSDSIIKIILLLQNEFNTFGKTALEITPHRIMGMLSSFSRKKQAFLSDENVWKYS